MGQVYFPQHCLHFLPEPHVVEAPILSILFIFIVLFPLFIRLGNIYIICIIDIIFTINISLLWTRRGLCPHPFTDISISHSYFLANVRLNIYTLTKLSSDIAS